LPDNRSSRRGGWVGRPYLRLPRTKAGASTPHSSGTGVELTDSSCPLPALTAAPHAPIERRADSSAWSRSSHQAIVRTALVPIAVPSSRPPDRLDDRCEVLVFGEPAQAGGHRLGGDEAAAEERQEHQRHGQVAGRLDALGHQATPQTTMSAGTWIRRIAASCSRLSSSVVGCQRSPAPGGGTRRPLRRSPTIGARLHIAARRHGVGDVRRYNPDGHGRVRHAPTVPQRVAYRRCTARVTDIGDRSAAVAPHLIGPLVEEGSAAVVDVEEPRAARPWCTASPAVRPCIRSSTPPRPVATGIDGLTSGSGWRVA
jgi:hypothetical protein